MKLNMGLAPTEGNFDQTKIIHAKRQIRPLGLFCIGLFLLIFAGFGTYRFLIWPSNKNRQAKQWIQKPCLIISAKVQSHDSDDETRYSVDITYEYKHQEKMYRSNRYDFLEITMGSHQKTQEIVNRYKTMSNPVCYVNPENPSEAVLRRDLDIKNMILMLPVLLLLWILGLFVTRDSIFGSRQKHEAPASPC